MWASAPTMFYGKLSIEPVSVSIGGMQPPNLPRHCETSPQTGCGNPHSLCIITQDSPHEERTDCHVAALLAMTWRCRRCPFLSLHCFIKKTFVRTRRGRCPHRPEKALSLGRGCPVRTLGGCGERPHLSIVGDGFLVPRADEGIRPYDVLRKIFVRILRERHPCILKTQTAPEASGAVIL